MPDFANMTEEEQIAFAMQMSMQDQRNSHFNNKIDEKKSKIYFCLQLMKCQHDKLNVPSRRRLQWKSTK